MLKQDEVRKKGAPRRTTRYKSGNGFPTREEIARRAYEIFQARGSEPGRELEDWLEAERELREARAKF